MQHLLEEWGHTVLTVASFDEALDRTSKHPDIDLLLTDHRLALANGVTGIDTIDAVRAALGHEVAAAIITGDTSPETLRGIQVRALRLLHKPLDEEELRKLLAGSLRRPDDA
jgi:CheY-like chemotaxis protein